ncbi:MAG: MFS transporter [Ktedonobacteraceae bacterium]
MDTMIHAIEKGTVEYRKVVIGLFLGGFVTFAVMYCTQPLLPIYSQEFHVTPAVASLAISTTTGVLAVMMTIIAAISNAWGRKLIMSLSLLAASALTICAALSPNFWLLLVVRALEGLSLAGVPAIAMTYLGEEVHPRNLGAAMGMYIGGNAIGGMLGRIITGLLTDFYSWRIALACIGLIGLACAFWFSKELPASTHFVARPLSLKQHGKSLLAQLKDPGLLCVYGIGFLLMAGFVPLYSYMGYQLMARPYNLSQAAVGWIFAVYIVGTVGSTWLGSLADRYPRRHVLGASIGVMGLGALLTLIPSVPIKIAGTAIFTFCFFGSHSIASSQVGKRAGRDKAQASALYLFAYYAGSSIGGSLGGLFWSTGGWMGVIGMIVAFLLSGLALSMILPLIPLRSIRQVAQDSEVVGERCYA